jgi:hypothetical protein
VEAVGLRSLWPLEATTGIVEPDALLLSEKKHAADVLQPVALRMRLLRHGRRLGLVVVDAEQLPQAIPFVAAPLALLGLATLPRGLHQNGEPAPEFAK